MPAYKNSALPWTSGSRICSAHDTGGESRHAGGAGWMETVPTPAWASFDQDGRRPLGVRSWAGPHVAQPPQVHSTAFPSNSALAAAWDPELVRSEGKPSGRK